MKTYTKTHTSRKAADAHLEKIGKRGGEATLTHFRGKYHIEYRFPFQQKKVKKKQYDVLSPDGKSIRVNVPPFTSIKASREYFDKWKLKFGHSGYWSPKKGLIPMSKLKGFCKWIEVK